MKRYFLFITALLIYYNASAKCYQHQENKDRSSIVIANDTCLMIDNYINQLVKEKNFSGGLLIIKNGKKVFSKGYGWANRENKIPFTTETLASMGSITKAFTAAAILKLCEEGKLSVTDNLQKIFSHVPPDKATITIHQLLTHSSGFGELQNDGGDYEKINKEEYLNKVFKDPLSFSPGTKAVYTNVGMSLLAIIIEQVSGMDYESFLQKKLFQPAGVKRISYAYPTFNDDELAHGYQNGKDWGTHSFHFTKAGGGPYWNLKGNGGLVASLNDMYLWVTGIANNTFLTKASIEKMFTSHIIEEGTQGAYSFGYGCNISKSRRNTKVIDNGGSNGIYHARLLRLPEEEVVFYMVTNESSINTNMVLPDITQLYFTGKISQDAPTKKFNEPVAQKIYDILVQEKALDLGGALNKAGIYVQDDMILLKVGEELTGEQKIDEAIALYKYYTTTFPNIVVAWNDLGDLYLKQGKKDEAVKCYNQALKLRPGNVRAKESLDRLIR